MAFCSYLLFFSSLCFLLSFHFPAGFRVGKDQIQVWSLSPNLSSLMLCCCIRFLSFHVPVEKSTTLLVSLSLSLKLLQKFVSRRELKHIDHYWGWVFVCFFVCESNLCDICWLFRPHLLKKKKRVKDLHWIPQIPVLPEMSRRVKLGWKHLVLEGALGKRRWHERISRVIPARLWFLSVNVAKRARQTFWKFKKGKWS